MFTCICMENFDVTISRDNFIFHNDARARALHGGLSTLMALIKFYRAHTHTFIYVYKCIDSKFAINSWVCLGYFLCICTSECPHLLTISANPKFIFYKILIFIKLYLHMYVRDFVFMILLEKMIMIENDIKFFQCIFCYYFHIHMKLFQEISTICVHIELIHPFQTRIISFNLK